MHKARPRVDSRVLPPSFGGVHGLEMLDSRGMAWDGQSWHTDHRYRIYLISNTSGPKLVLFSDRGSFYTEFLPVDVSNRTDNTPALSNIGTMSLDIFNLQFVYAGGRWNLKGKPFPNLNFVSCRTCSSGSPMGSVALHHVNPKLNGSHLACQPALSTKWLDWQNGRNSGLCVQALSTWKPFLKCFSLKMVTSYKVSTHMPSTLKRLHCLCSPGV